MFYCQRMSFDEILHHYIAPRKSLQKKKKEKEEKTKRKIKLSWRDRKLLKEKTGAFQKSF